jgi:hypothetical protein
MFAIQPIRTFLMAATVFLASVSGRADKLERNSQLPSPDARPWVYWFWNNGNVTSNGITADLEAMQRVGLGAVQVMARVKLNGQDCGIAWKPPYRVDMAAAVRAGKNSREIQVANLWPNRMIGDAALPENRRLTWSSWEPFDGDSLLLPSGLFGPVKILELK